MGLLSTIFSKIFPSSHAGTPSSPQPPQQSAAGSLGTAQQSSTAATPPTQAIDVEKVLNDMASRNSQKLNWRTSIVDLMKLVGMDSSQSARQELARELHYTGDMNDSASMNIWLHKQVMKKLSENGGKVPQDLLH
jgi:hypothetical protein